MNEISPAQILKLRVVSEPIFFLFVLNLCVVRALFLSYTGCVSVDWEVFVFLEVSAVVKLSNGIIEACSSIISIVVHIDTFFSEN